MLEEEKVTECLRENGFKVTPQRLAVYTILCHTKRHPNVDYIYRKLQPIYPTMSLATVYKTLDILHTIGLVQILNVGEESFRYDANISSHPHIKCTCCGRVDDINDTDDISYLAKLAEHTDYKLTGRQIYIYGLCPECQLKKRHQAEN